MSTKKKGKREYLNNFETKDFTTKLNNFFETCIEVPRIKVGKRQRIETLINEEALLLAKFLRKELEKWVLRISNGLTNDSNYCAWGEVYKR